jgi:hypothetical protein
MKLAESTSKYLQVVKGLIIVKSKKTKLSYKRSSTTKTQTSNSSNDVSFSIPMIESTLAQLFIPRRVRLVALQIDNDDVMPLNRDNYYKTDI